MMTVTLLNERQCCVWTAFMCQPVQNYVLGGHWGLFVTVFLTFFIFGYMCQIKHTALSF